jgi:hypothetical protein
MSMNRITLKGQYHTKIQAIFKKIKNFYNFGVFCPKSCVVFFFFLHNISKSIKWSKKEHDNMNMFYPDSPGFIFNRPKQNAKGR